MRWGLASRGRFGMTRTHAAWLVLALGLFAAPAWGQAEGPFFVTFLADPQAPQICELPPGFTLDGDGAPVIPPAMLPVGVPQTFDLCAALCPASVSSPTGCIGATDVMLAVRARYTTSGGQVTFDFVPAEDFVDNPEDVDQIRAFGGEPVEGQSTYRLGSVSFTAQDAGVVFQNVAADSLYVSANEEEMSVPEQELAMSMSSCGNGSLDAGETCDDANLLGGDGCSRDCQQEQNFYLQGSAGGGATLSFDLDTQPFSFNLPAGTTAAQAIEQAVLTVTADPVFTTPNPLNVAAVQALSPDQPPGFGEASPNGHRFSTKFPLANVQVSGEFQLPEPGELWLLGSGVLFLRLLGRRRMRS